MLKKIKKYYKTDEGKIHIIVVILTIIMFLPAIWLSIDFLNYGREIAAIMFIFHVIYLGKVISKIF